MKSILFLSIIILSGSCTCRDWKFKKGDIVEQKLVKGLLVVQDTLTLNGENSYRLISGTGKRRIIEEYKLYQVELNQIH